MCKPDSSSHSAHIKVPKDSPKHTLYLRNIPEDIHEQIHGSAGARNMSVSEYVIAIARLHAAVRDVLAKDDGDLDSIRRIVEKVGLTPVTR